MKNRNGFSLIELMFALIIITVGMLALATTTGYITIQTRVADLRTARAAAVSQMAEQVRSLAFDSIQTMSQPGSNNIGEFKVWRSSALTNSNLKTISIFSQGPGYRPRTGWTQTATDTFVITVVKPF